MRVRPRLHQTLLFALLALLAASALLAGCTTGESGETPQDATSSDETQQGDADDAEPAPEAGDAATYAWTEIELTDVITGETFVISDFAGSQVLMQAFAVW